MSNILSIYLSPPPFFVPENVMQHENERKREKKRKKTLSENDA